MTKNEVELLRRLRLAEATQENYSKGAWIEFGWICGINPRTVRALENHGLVETTMLGDEAAPRPHVRLVPIKPE